VTIPFLLANVLLLGAAGIFIWLLGTTLRERATLRRSLAVAMLQVALPRAAASRGQREEESAENIKVAQQMLSVLAYLPTSLPARLLFGRPLVVLEIVARPDGLTVLQIGTEKPLLERLQKQVYAFYPEAEVSRAPDRVIAEEGRIIRTGRLDLRAVSGPTEKAAAVPAEAVVGALAGVRLHDAAVVQFVCRSAGRAAWRRDRARERFQVTARVAVVAGGPEEADRVFTAVARSLARSQLRNGTALTVHRSERHRAVWRDLVWHVPRERGALSLSAYELARLFHFLSSETSVRVRRRGARVAPAPVDLPRRGVLIGHNDYGGVRTPIYLTRHDRRQHLYCVGQAGNGKTTLLLNLAVQDIRAGRGVGVMDSTGDLVEDVLLYIPPERIHDVVLFDSRDTRRPVGFNVLAADSVKERAALAEELADVLKTALAQKAGASQALLERCLHTALRALADDEDATLVDLPRMFREEDFRARVLNGCSDRAARQFWREALQAQRRARPIDALAGAIESLERLVGDRTVRNITGQSRSSFDMRQILNERKILLCTVSRNNLGDPAADFLGALLLIQLRRTIMARPDAPAERTPDFYLYSDEFQQLLHARPDVLIAEAERSGVSLTVAHQSLRSLEQAAHIGARGSMVSLRAGAPDVAELPKRFRPVFGAEDFLNFAPFSAAAQLLVAGDHRRPFSLTIAPPPPGARADVRATIRRYSRRSYGRPLVEVEEQILRRRAGSS
jgi:hypothetical protein